MPREREPEWDGSNEAYRPVQDSSQWQGAAPPEVPAGWIDPVPVNPPESLGRAQPTFMTRVRRRVAGWISPDGTVRWRDGSD